MRSVRALACVVLMLGAAASTAHAKAELTVSPTILRLEGKPGETITEQLSVSAGADEPIVVQLVHADFGFEDSSYQVTLIRDDAEETTSFSTRGWFSLPKPRYRIPAGRTMQLPLRIEIPENTPGGTYLGAALLRVVPPDAAPGASQVQAVPETGPLVFIAVEGGDPPKAALRRFDLPAVVRRGPLRPDLVVENRGDEFFSYEGSIELRGPGKDDRVEVKRQFVVPGQPRRVRTSPDETGESGRPTLGSSSLGFGQYEVRTRLRIEPTGTALVATRTVWVIPIWTRVLAGIVLLVVAISLGLLLRWYLERRRIAAFVAEAEAEDEHEHEHELLDDEDFDGAHAEEDDPFVR